MYKYNQTLTLVNKKTKIVKYERGKTTGLISVKLDNRMYKI